MADLYQWVISFVKDYGLNIRTLDNVEDKDINSDEDLNFDEKTITIRPLFLYHAMNLASISLYPSLSDYSYYPQILNKQWIFDLNSTYLKKNNDALNLNSLDQMLLNKEISLGIMKYIQTVYQNTPYFVESKYLRELDSFQQKAFYKTLPEYIFFDSNKSKVQYAQNLVQIQSSTEVSNCSKYNVPIQRYITDLTNDHAVICINQHNNQDNKHSNDHEYSVYKSDLDRIFKAKLLFFAGFYKESASLVKKLLYNEYYRQNKTHQERKSNMGTYFGTQEKLLSNNQVKISVFKGIHEDILDNTNNSFNQKGFNKKNSGNGQSNYFSETTILKNETILQSYSPDGSMLELHIEKIANF